MNFPINGTVYIEFLDGGGGSLGFSSSAFTASDGVVTRISRSDVAVSGTVSARFVVTGENYASNPAHYTQCLIEQTSTLQPYFDGDSSGATWDGTPGSSTSTLTDSNAGALNASLPSITAATSGSVIVVGTAGATLPAFNAAATGTATAAGLVAAGLPSLQAAAAGTVTAAGAVVTGLPSLQASAGGAVAVPGAFAVPLPPLAAGVAGTVQSAGGIAAFLPSLGTALAGQVNLEPLGVLAASLPTLAANTTGTSDATPPESPRIVVGPPGLGWPIGRPTLQWPVGTARTSWPVGPPGLGGE
ncbi:hypothetical protein [Nonomuraea sp. 10N515B]|uniref:hypothetical protein n=1 Tax=Nonomuraea sp. 10N515B TaxID=3457422 RepID=UPI003FCE21ED